MKNIQYGLLTCALFLLNACGGCEESPINTACASDEECLAEQICVDGICHTPDDALFPGSDAGQNTSPGPSQDSGVSTSPVADAGGQQNPDPVDAGGPSIIPGFDSDGDGLTDDEEVAFGSDCSVSNPFSPDTDEDGIPDGIDPYAQDPWPEFMVRRGATEGIELYLSNRDGSFEDAVTIGQPIFGDPEGNGSETLLSYTDFAIGDFDHNGKMDFLAKTSAISPDEEYQVWFFTRNEKKDEFDQRLIGVVGKTSWAIVLDADGDTFFDLALLKIVRPNNVSTVDVQVYLNNRQPDATCFAEESENTNCFFRKMPDMSLNGIAANQWHLKFAKQAVNLNPSEDDHLDLTVGTYASGGAASTPTYTLFGNGDGTFQEPVLKFTHAGNLGPANTMLFADFNNDDIGDIITGFDDDGSPGAGWFYAGQPGGTLTSQPIQAIDLNPTDANETAGGFPMESLGRTGSGRTFDFNFDGNYDLIIGYQHVAYENPGQTRLYFGNGDGTFDPDFQVIGDETDHEHKFSVPTKLCPTYELDTVGLATVDGGVTTTSDDGE
ncbi:MAG: hypothetical protein CMH56_06265 [Myxococcales bacterium]|nr:hypothetical protein [Myxococcales bacterium]